jgi:hypothetical protein
VLIILDSSAKKFSLSFSLLHATAAALLLLLMGEGTAPPGPLSAPLPSSTSADDGLRFLKNLASSDRVPAETLRVDLVDIFGSRRTGREPSVFRTSLSSRPSEGSVSRGPCEDRRYFFSRQFGACSTCSGESFRQHRLFVPAWRARPRGRKTAFPELAHKGSVKVAGIASHSGP